MYICQNHWHVLKNAIRQRGLWSLVTPAGYLAAETPEEILELNTAQFRFDPLMAASLMVSEQARAAFGPALGSGAHCPLCEVDENFGAGMAEDWIDIDTDIILKLCRDRQLVPVEDM
jgi:hypothetical protein